MKASFRVTAALVGVFLGTASVLAPAGPARGDDTEFLSFLLEQYAEPQFDVPSADPFDITRFLGEPDATIPEASRWSWMDRYFYDGQSPSPWISIAWPHAAWRGPF